MTSRGNFLKNVSRIRRNERHLCKIQGKGAWPRHSTPPICRCPASNTNHSSCLGAMNVQHTFEQNLSFNKCLSCPHYFIKSWVLKMHFRNPSVKGNPLPVWGIIFSTEKSFSPHTNELVTCESPFPACECIYCAKVFRLWNPTLKHCSAFPRFNIRQWIQNTPK